MAKRIISALILTVLLLLPLQGCQQHQPTDSPILTVLIAGNHEGSFKLNLDLENIVSHCYSTLGNVAIIINDQDPSLLYSEDGVPIGYIDSMTLQESEKRKKANKELWQSTIDEQAKEVVSDIDVAVPDSSESNMLAALQTAVDALGFLESSYDGNVTKEIIIFDTGLSTSGTLNFLTGDAYNLLCSKGKISEDKNSMNTLASLIQDLDNHAELPQLSDITVKWFGLGTVADPQADLTQLQIKNLQYIWQELLTVCGANAQESNSDTNSYFQTALTSLPQSYDYSVTPVIFWSDAEIKIPVQKLGFKKNSADFESSNDAMDILKPYANNLANYPDQDILIVGTTADDHKDNLYPTLSEDRAQAVRKILIELGISKERIKILGLGYKSPWHKQEWNEGVFDEQIAAENRAVYILSMDSSRAINLCQQYNESIK